MIRRTCIQIANNKVPIIYILYIHLGIALYENNWYRHNMAKCFFSMCVLKGFFIIYKTVIAYIILESCYCFKLFHHYIITINFQIKNASQFTC